MASAAVASAHMQHPSIHISNVAAHAAATPKRRPTTIVVQFLLTVSELLLRSSRRKGMGAFLPIHRMQAVPADAATFLAHTLRCRTTPLQPALLPMVCQHRLHRFDRVVAPFCVDKRPYPRQAWHRVVNKRRV